MPPRRRLLSPRFWIWLAIFTLIAMRFATLTPVQGVRDFSIPPIPAGRCEVIRVDAVDRFVVRPVEQSQEFVVRLSGVQLDKKFAIETREFTANFLKRGPLRVSLDIHRIDEAGVRLVYLHAGDELLNEALLSAGVARYRPTPGNSAVMEKRLRSAELAAKEAKVGMWR